MLDGRIRLLALCIIKNKDSILVTQGHDDIKNQTYYRILGGGIEFGERGEQALKREFREELNTELENVKYITTLENLFTFNGKPGHEIALIFQGELSNKQLYEQDEIAILDSKANSKAYWKPLQDFKDNKLILYPDSIVGYI